MTGQAASPPPLVQQIRSVLQRQRRMVVGVGGLTLILMLELTAVIVNG